MITVLISLAIGIVAATLDVAPMILQKLDRAFICSAASTWIVLALFIPRIEIVPINWLNGIIVALLFILPIVFLVTKLDRNAIPLMIGTTIVLGAGIGLLSDFFMK